LVVASNLVCQYQRTERRARFPLDVGNRLACKSSLAVSITNAIRS
jgi:hypothetical protein